MKFIIGFLVTIGLLVFVFVMIFRGGGDSSTQTNKEGSKLLNYANTSVEMQFTTLGPVSADLTHNSVRVTIGNTSSSIDVVQGYEGHITATKSYANNSAAYADFLQALQLAGYNLGSTDKTLADERGRCATGNRYVLGIKDGNREIQRYWSTTCGGAATSKAKPDIIKSLFVAQIPDYDEIVGDTL